MDASVNILTYILEDDTDLKELIEDVLKANNITHYHIYDDPTEFLNQLTADINICVIDHRLNSGMTGLDVIKAVKEKNEDSYVIIMTGITDYKVIGEYMEQGGDSYVDKNSLNYMDEFVSKLLKGFKKAEIRIKQAHERKLIGEEMLARMRETAELTKQLKPVE